MVSPGEKNSAVIVKIVWCSHCTINLMRNPLMKAQSTIKILQIPKTHFSGGIRPNSPDSSDVWFYNINSNTWWVDESWYHDSYPCLELTTHWLGMTTKLSGRNAILWLFQISVKFRKYGSRPTWCMYPLPNFVKTKNQQCRIIRSGRIVGAQLVTLSFCQNSEKMRCTTSDTILFSNSLMGIKWSCFWHIVLDNSP